MRKSIYVQSCTGDLYHGKLSNLKVNYFAIMASLFALSVNVANANAKLSIMKDHALLVQADGSLYAAGEHQCQEYLDRSRVDPIFLIKDVSRNPFSQIGNDRDWSTASAGLYHSMAIKQDGSLWAWGCNTYNGEVAYLLGDGTSSNFSIPIQIGTDKNWVAVSANHWHTLALKDDGSVWGWGNNYHGEMGNGSKVDALRPIEIGKGYKKIAVGTYHSVGLKSDGSIWVWGHNRYGQLGDGTTVDSLVPKQVGVGFVEISANGHSTAAIKQDGSLWLWGLVQELKLPVEPSKYIDFQGVYLLPTRISEGRFVSVNLARDGGLAVQQDGTLLGWGNNWKGALGQYRPELPHQFFEEVLETGKDYQSAVLGICGGFGVKKDGSIWGWGWLESRLSSQRKIEVTPPRSDFSVVASKAKQNELLAHINPADSDLGKQVFIYVAIAFQNGKLFLSLDGKFIPWSNGSLPAHSKIKLEKNSVITIPEIPQGPDYGSGRLFLGYGLNEKDMLENMKYENIYAIK